MIPGTAIPTTRPPADDTLQPARNSQKVSDSLSDFQPGQRLIATIQSQLANGTYRAVIAQRDVTLALPFTAKVGDRLKLEVVDTRGRVAFALADDGAAGAGKEQPSPSTTTTLSAAGRVIGALFAKPMAGGGEPAPVVLNRGQPLAPPPTENGALLAPALQKAVVQSGLFFETHLAAWVAGTYPKAELLREPQARLPRTPGGEPAPRGAEAARGGPATGGPAGSAPGSAAGGAASGATQAGGQPPGSAGQAAGAVAGQRAGAVAAPPPGSFGAISPTSEAGVRGGTAPLFNLPGEASPLVYQQLNALATHVYAFQAQPWANQQLHWELVDKDGRPAGGDEPANAWQSRLSLSLPALGEIDAVLRLAGDRLSIDFRARRPDTRETLGSAVESLRDRLSALGLSLAQVAVSPPEDRDAAA